MNEINFKLSGLTVTGEDSERFEGPLTLILMLLSKNKIEIQNIEISEICKQYLQHLENQAREGLEIKSEFVQMASYLVYLKSKSLLVNEEGISELEDLIATLEKQKNKIMLEEIQTKLDFFEKRSEVGRQIYTREAEADPKANSIENLRADKNDLFFSIFRLISERPDPLSFREEKNKIAPARIVYGVNQKITEIIRLFKGGEELLLNDIYNGVRSVSEAVATFLAVLELSTEGRLKLYVKGDELYLAINEFYSKERTDDSRNREQEY